MPITKPLTHCGECGRKLSRARNEFVLCNSCADEARFLDWQYDNASEEVVNWCSVHNCHMTDCEVAGTHDNNKLNDMVEKSENTPLHQCSSLCGYFDCEDVEADPQGCYASLVL